MNHRNKPKIISQSVKSPQKREKYTLDNTEYK